MEAIKRFRDANKNTSSFTALIFVIASDDLKWCKVKEHELLLDYYATIVWEQK